MSPPATSDLLSLVRAHGDATPLDRSAALLAAEEQPGLDPEAVLASLDALAAPVRIPSTASPYEAVARLNHQLFATLGFSGDAEQYYHPRNSLLDQVITRRKGLPILLSIVYVEVARRAGFAVDGVGFPGHFLVGTRGDEETPRFFVDPYHAGAIRTSDELGGRLRGLGLAAVHDAEFLAPTPAPQVLLRISYNLKGAYLRLQRPADALRQVERVLGLAPERLDEHRDRGLLLAEAGRGEEAHAALSLYLSLRPDADDAEVIQSMLAQLS